ncbi:acyl-CoA dehydrogenase [Saccharomonospora iraqiensis]|uniref:acyl-CoA dehydrogenase n=1 Tax=Saccharomonospora iraqiensis TaxID=52698 RepID=UPI00022E4638|nr:acyl-CoA dehydrogenase [Saccharomonospora iraqiensis]
MTLGLTEEHTQLRDAVRAFAARHVTAEVVRAAVDADTDGVPPFWTALAGQELLGLHLPEEHGGSGFGLLETAVVVEELGRALTPGPVVPTVTASAVLHRAGHHAHLPDLATGRGVGAVGLGAGTLALRWEADGTAVASGTPDPVSGGATADVFVLPAHDDGGTTWVVLSRAEVETTELVSHDPTRRLARVHVPEIRLSPDSVLSGTEAELPREVAAVLLAAEASGLAEWATTTAAGHAATREQFGRPIGQFQGVKHRCARMLVRAEQARVCAWDAARALDADTGVGAVSAETSLAAAVAGASSVEAAFATAKDCIQVLGGIGFTWEHDAGLVLRRAQSSRLLLGPTATWHRTVARAALAGVRRGMGVELPPEAETVRSRIRAELEPARERDAEGARRYLAEHGYTAPHLPEPWGKGADGLTQLVIDEELAAADLSPVDMVIGNWVVPTLIEHGSAQQQQRFLPSTLRGETVWCQLFSEPGAGSDLAALRTRAEKVEGGWRLSGQKVWTSAAREAHWAICLARTDPSVRKHKGLSYFLVDMSAPGIEIRPLRELTGDALFNEVFLDEVFVPDDALVGEAGDGWKLARTTLANERVALSRGSSLGDGGETLLELAVADGTPDADRLAELGALLADAQSGGLFRLRGVLRSLTGGQPGAESSVGKFLGVEHAQRVWETVMDWRGVDALVGPSSRGGSAWMFLNTRCLSIAGGTTEIQLNIIGERILGLPRDP